ncbi:unnamed protein product, partial [Rotaria magnacalcarata]
MKLLNDKKQFEKALAIFDQHAYANVRDLQRGKIIHNLIASETKNGIYVSSTLIHMYAQCADIASAQSLFDSTKNKTSSMYRIMMK